MQQRVSRLSSYISRYREVLQKPLNFERLPIVGESKIFKPSASRYGHVILKIELDTDTSNPFPTKYNFSWEPDERKYSGDVLIPLSKYHEPDILKEIQVFVTLLDFVNENGPPLKFTVVGGSERTNERPYFDSVTAEAIIDVFKKLAE